MIYARRSRRFPKGAAGLFSDCFGLSAQVVDSQWVTKTFCFVLQNVPFRIAKRHVLASDMACFARRNGAGRFLVAWPPRPACAAPGLRRGRRASCLCTFVTALPAPGGGVSACRCLPPSLLSSGRSRWLRPGLLCRGAYGSASSCAGWPARLRAPPPRRGGAGSRLWRASLAAR